jgi:hypothetical protein
MTMPMIIPLIDAPNRQHKRAMEKEAKKLLENLTVLEVWFLNELFNDDVSASYKQLYDHYWKQYVDEIERLRKIVKPKYFRVNSDYFWQNYGPVEKTKK